MVARKQRCPWADTSPAMIAYHDTEWGVPVHDDRLFFEHLILDNMQAGLSWAIILYKREGFRRAFAGFDPRKVAKFDVAKVRKLLADPGIVRNRLKVAAAIANARAFLEVQREFGSFDAFIWSHLPNAQPIINHRHALRDIPARSELSDALSLALKIRGFKFVGSTIVYAFMQATGMVNDHLVTCPRHAEVQA